MDENKRIEILYIEDDPDLIDLVALILHRPDFHLRTASGGRAGLDLVFSEPTDLVLLDLMMPDIDGWDVYQQIKANPTTRSIPIIVITAKTLPIDRLLGLRVARVDDYLCKPFRPQELLDSIRRIFERQGRQIATLSPSK